MSGVFIPFYGKKNNNLCCCHHEMRSELSADGFSAPCKRGWKQVKHLVISHCSPIVSCGQETSYGPALGQRSIKQ